MKFYLFLAVFCSFLLISPVYAAQQSTANMAGLDTVIWKPDTIHPRHKYPLIIFSHGFGGCNTQSAFLTTGLADAGYIVLAPDHADAKCGRGGAGAGSSGEQGGIRKKLRERLKERMQNRTTDQQGGAIGGNRGDRNGPSFRDIESWDDTSYRNRADDIEKLLDAALSDPDLGSLIDTDNIGMAGHSLGGYTALGLAGAWPSWKNGQIKAVLALSPYSSPYITKGALGDMNVPVMYQGGTRDRGVTPYVKKPGGVYALSSSPKYYVEFEGAGHFSWTNVGDEFHPVMLQYGRAFFDQHLRGQKSPILSQKLPKVTELRAE